MALSWPVPNLSPELIKMIPSNSIACVGTRNAADDHITPSERRDRPPRSRQLENFQEGFPTPPDPRSEEKNQSKKHRDNVFF